MRHEQVADGPPGRIRWGGIHADPEKRQLIPEAATSRGRLVARVVPPLDSVFGMARVIARQVQQATGLGATPPIGLLGPSRHGEGRGEERQNHSSRPPHAASCSAGGTAAATRAGYKPASDVARNSAIDDWTRNRPGT